MSLPGRLSRNALTKQYRRLFEMEGVDLEFMDGALRAVAHRAMQRKTGARGLRTVIEETLMEVMYMIPSMNDVRKCVITEETIRFKRQPLLLAGNGQPIVVPPGEQKTA